jgi:hypothetical protein
VEELSRSRVLNHRELKRKRGFLIYVTQTYPAMIPYLKGIHQTLETWRPNRKASAWKRKASREKDPMMAVAHAQGSPKFVEAAPRLTGDLETLQHLTLLVQLLRRRIRPAATLKLYHGLGDASAVGFILDMLEVLKEDLVGPPWALVQCGNVAAARLSQIIASSRI